VCEDALVLADNLRQGNVCSPAVEPPEYHFDTIRGMAMTLRLTDDEQTALRERAEAEGISLQEAARRAVRDYVTRGQHRDRVSEAAARVMSAHADALTRLGR
jgi:hypothetical protein